MIQTDEKEDEMENHKRIKKEYREKFLGLSRNFPMMKPEEVCRFMGLSEDELYESETDVSETAPKPRNSRGRKKHKPVK